MFAQDLNDPVLTLFVLWECVPEVKDECLNDSVEKGGQAF